MDICVQDRATEEVATIPGHIYVQKRIADEVATKLKSKILTLMKALIHKQPHCHYQTLRPLLTSSHLENNKLKFKLKHKYIAKLFV